MKKALVVLGIVLAVFVVWVFGSDEEDTATRTPTAPSAAQAKPTPTKRPRPTTTPQAAPSPAAPAAYSENPAECFDDETFDTARQICIFDGDAKALDKELAKYTDQLFPSGDDFDAASELDESLTDADAEVSADETDLITYTVRSDTLSRPQAPKLSDAAMRSLQRDRETQAKMWDFFTSLVPLEERRDISQFVVFTDGPDNLLAWVMPDENDENLTVLGVDIQDIDAPGELTSTLIHEFGHMLTLSTSQGRYLSENGRCHYYRSEDWCSLKNAYITAFVDQFWPADFMAEWEDTQVDDPAETEDLVYQFYETYADEFVSDYAATNADEDIAESWMEFVLKPKPRGSSVADQKVKFFYDYPELVSLRQQLASRAISRLRHGE